jgi:hypothetical protein
MTLNEFKDLCAGFQSIAIVVAAFLGGGWALFRFFSLRELDKARLEHEKARLEREKVKRELAQQAVIVVELVAESFDIDGSYFLHVRVVMRNIGSGVDFVDWTKASMFARRFHKVDEITLAATDQVLSAWRAPSMVIQEMRLMPGFSTSESFLMPIPQVGVYYIEFSMPVSKAVRAEMVDAIENDGVKMNAEDVVIWRADKFVSVP